MAALVVALARADAAALARLDLWPPGLAALTSGLAILSLAADRERDPVRLASLPLGAAAVFVALTLLAQPGAPSGGLRLATATPVHLALALVSGAILAGLAVALGQQALAPRGRDFLRALTGLLPLLGFTGTVLGIMAALGALPEVLADIAANLLCLVVVVLAVAALRAGGGGGPVASLPRTAATPLGAAQMVEVLRMRLHPAGSPQAERIDLTAGGARTAPVPGVAPGPGAPAVVYVLAQDHHAALVAQLRAAGRDRVELDVPEALGDGRGDWNPAFAALAPEAADTARFAPALARLLAGPRPARAAPSLAEAPPSRARALIQATLALGGLALVLAVWGGGLAAARRRRRTA